MKASGSVTLYDTTDDVIPSATAPIIKSVGQLWFDTANNTLYKWSGTAWEKVVAESVKTSKVEITDAGIDIESTGKVNIKSGAEMEIATGGELKVSGGRLEVTAGTDAGTHFKIENDAETVIFGGADDDEGANAGFSLGRNGRLDCNDAHIKGSVELMDGAEFAFGDGATASFGDNARMTFIQALFGGADSGVSVIPTGSGIVTRDELRAFLGLYSGQEAPATAVPNPKYGDVYFQLAGSTQTEPTALTFTLSGYQQQITKKQKRVIKKTNGVTNSDVTTTTATIYDSIVASDAAYAYNGSTADSGSSTSTSTQYATSATIVTTTTTYNRKQTFYWSVCPAPTPSQLAASPVESSTITFTFATNPSYRYALYLTDGVNGKGTLRTLIGAKDVDGTTVTFDLSGAIETLRNAGTTVYYLSLETARTTAMNTARAVTGVTMDATYIGGTETAVTWAYDGATWKQV